MANLQQLRNLEELNGFLLVDKPEHIPFSVVVKTVKRKFNLVKVGHGGSLDAQATGLLILLLGDANKFVDRVMGADREYEAEFDFSHTTTTGDAYGVKVEESKVEGLKVEERLKAVKGDVFLSEPKFAAIRREGTADYEIVDTGNHPQVMGHVYRIEVRGEREEGRGERECVGIKATKQVLPRSLAVEMGATLTKLRRTAIGNFRVENAVSFERLLNCELKDFPALVMPVGAALKA